MQRILLVLVLAASLLLNGCGTLLKKNQVNKPHSNKLDYKIVLLDGLGLILFIVPGVVAYAVDYSNGTLYLPGGGGPILDDMPN